jgi:lantibiotic modifying enzyme
MAFWCHGAAGITRFLARLGQLSEDAGALELARRGALVVATGTRWSGVSQCHGLAGNVECLLDMYQTTTEESYLVDAMSMARLMHAFAVEHDERFRLTTGRGSSNPGFSTGCAGVAACLLRLTDPHTRPHLLSLRSFNGTNVGRSDARHDSVAT